MHRKNRTYDKLPLPLFTYELYTCGRYRVASRTPLTTPSVIAYVSGSFDWWGDVAGSDVIG